MYTYDVAAMYGMVLTGVVLLKLTFAPISMRLIFIYLFHEMERRSSIALNHRRNSKCFCSCFLLFFSTHTLTQFARPIRAYNVNGFINQLKHMQKYIIDDHFSFMGTKERKKKMHKEK